MDLVSKTTEGYTRTLEKDGFIYTISSGHFSIDCVCGSKKPGIFYNTDKEDIEGLERATNHKGNRVFYANLIIVRDFFFARGYDEKPINVKYRDCGKSLELTTDDYNNIKKEMGLR